MVGGTQYPGPAMEYQTCDSVNSAMARWRQELAAQAGLTAEIRRELEAHLRDCMAGFRQRGMSEDESFRLARQRVGRPQQLDAEFEKAMNTSSVWKRPLLIAAWAVYIVSFFLPSYATLYGWQCATLQHTVWTKATTGDLVSVHYELLTLANLLMLASPFLLGQFSQSVRSLQWLHHACLAATLLVWAFVVELVVHQEGAGIKLGCFVWCVSFSLLYTAVLTELVHLRREMGARHA